MATMFCTALVEHLTILDQFQDDLAFYTCLRTLHPGMESDVARLGHMVDFTCLVLAVNGLCHDGVLGSEDLHSVLLFPPGYVAQAASTNIL